MKPWHNDLGNKSESKIEEEACLSSNTFSRRRSDTNKGSRRRKDRGMVLPFQPLSLTFDEIRYSVDMPQVLNFIMSFWFFLFFYH